MSPSWYTSDADDRGWLGSSCSGDAYAGECGRLPMVVSWCSGSSSSGLAMPKSRILTASTSRSSPTRKTLAGFTSRCTMPARCPAATPRAASARMRRASAWGSGPSAQRLLEVAPHQQLHDDEVQLQLRVRAVVEDLDDVGVLDARSAGGLAPEPLAEVGQVCRARQRNDLYGHLAAQRAVQPPEHDAHPAAGHGVHQLVAAGERAAHHQPLEAPPHARAAPSAAAADVDADAATCRRAPR